MEKILIIGNGAREHAIAWALAKSAQEKTMACFATAINPGIKAVCQDYHLGDILDAQAVCAYAKNQAISLAIVGPEAPLEKGMADALWAEGIPTVGPVQALAQLETSKGFTRNLLKKYDLDFNPFYQCFDSLEVLRRF